MVAGKLTNGGCNSTARTRPSCHAARGRGGLQPAAGACGGWGYVVLVVGGCPLNKILNLRH